MKGRAAIPLIELASAAFTARALATASDLSASSNLRQFLERAVSSVEPVVILSIVCGYLVQQLLDRPQKACTNR